MYYSQENVHGKTCMKGKGNMEKISVFTCHLGASNAHNTLFCVRCKLFSQTSSCKNPVSFTYMNLYIFYASQISRKFNIAPMMKLQGLNWSN